LDLPKRNDGSAYLIENLKTDQMKIICFILGHLKAWMEQVGNVNVQSENLPYLRMTIRGKAGTGKSTLINTLITVLRTLFNSRNVAHVVAPTGQAAFNVGGQTVHRFLSCSDSNTWQTPFASTEERLYQDLRYVLCLIFDERLLLSSALFAQAEETIKNYGHGGTHKNLNISWGGTPIVIVVGDDMQLPSIGRGVLFIPFEKDGDGGKGYTKPTPSKGLLETRGQHLFLESGEKVVDLKKSRRINPDQLKYEELQQRFWNDTLQASDVQFLQNYHVDTSPSISNENKEIIKKRSMFLYPTRELKDEHNLMKLRELSSRANPVAFIQSECASGRIGYEKGISSHFRKSNSAPITTLLCRDAVVSLQHKNFCPEWGLYNGSIGTVKDIVFKKDHSPNNNNLPQYTVVEFPDYKGPAWLPEHPKYVPLPNVVSECDLRCCSREHPPLSLSFAKTIHSTQGINAGPTPDGQPDNAIKCLVIDPGEKEFETKCPGTAYTAFSRGTTLGGNDFLNSAIYVHGGNITKKRLLKMTLTQKRKVLMHILRRNKWVKYLDKHVVKDLPSDENISTILEWIESSKNRLEFCSKWLAKTITKRNERA